MYLLINLIHGISRDAWPVDNSTSSLPSEPAAYLHQRDGCDQRAPGRSERLPFSFETLETLWDPNLHRSIDTHHHSSSSIRLPLPRATYELDTHDWIKAPLSSDGRHRGIIQLACLVSDSSLHVHCDRGRLIHTNRFAARVEEVLRSLRSYSRQGLGSVRGKKRSDGGAHTDLSIMMMDDDAILNDTCVMDAIARAAGADLLIDDSGPSARHILRGPLTTDSTDPTDPPCAWLLRDVATGTWSARVFRSDSLLAPSLHVREVAFLHKINNADWRTGSDFSEIRQACQRAAIKVPHKCTREGLVHCISESFST